MQNKLIKLDVREVRSYNDVTNHDYSIRNTDIYITTAESPSLRLSIFGERNLPKAQRFIKTSCLHMLPPILGGVWFETNIQDLKKSKRTILMVVDTNSIDNFEKTDEAIFELVKHLVSCAKFTNQTFASDLVDYLISSYQTFRLTDGVVRQDNERHDDLNDIVSDERYLLAKLESDRKQLYSTMINGLFTKYCEMSNETVSIFGDKIGYEVTDVTIHQVQQIIDSVKQSQGGTVNVQDITDKLFFGNFGVN